MSKKTLILGASENPSRYSFLALKKLKTFGHPVIAIGKRAGSVDGTPILTGTAPQENIDTVTLYLNATHQKLYYDFILSLNPHRIIFNPGTENIELVKLAAEKNIKTLNACTLVMLSTNQY